MTYPKLPFALPFIREERAETAITHMIFFIAAIIIAMGVVAILSANVQSITGATSSSSKVLSEQLKTDITVISDPEVIPYNASTGYTFYAKNTGKSELAPGYVDVIVDGTLIAPANVTLSVQDGDTVWRPGDVLVIEVITDPDPLASGDHRIRVVAENGKSGSMSFKT